MTELPLVVVDVQRAGPCTGMPTKTEQADLNEVLYGRNGESPLVVVAAHSPANCFDMAFNAAKIALEHMVPVILLSEGFLGNGSEPWKIPSMKDYPAITPRLVKGGAGPFEPFQRDPQTLARNWAVPGMKGCEHRVGGLEKNHQGVLSNNPQNHETMVRERAEKVEKVADFIPELKVNGPESGDILVIGWGGTYGHILTAVEEMRAEGKEISMAHFDYISPLPKNTEEVFSHFGKIIVCELNCGQFATYLTGKMPHFNFIKCNKVQGQTFLVKEIVDSVEKAK
jgi:2-oxoglutarate ferredoxin oxidoreductase subunit alpha